MIPRESYAQDSPIRQHLHTPNIDRLMADGTRFDYAFSTSPLCGPSRAAMLTGRYPYLTANEERAHDGWEVGLRPSDAIYPEYLRAVGYNTKHVGKCHVGTAKFMQAFGENDSPWNRWAPPLTDDDGYLRYLGELGVTPPAWHEPVVGLRPDRKTPGNSYGGWVTQADGSDFPEEATYSQYLAWLAEQSLDAARTQGEGPVYLQLDFFAPHQPFLVPQCYGERARELEQHIELPASYAAAIAGELDGYPRIYQTYLRNWGLYEKETARRYMLMNYLQIEALDAAIGKLLQALDERGMYEDSVVIFTGDHGEMNCELGLVDKGVYGHPRVAMVPLSVKLPAGEETVSERPELVTLLDIAPTVLDVAGVTPTERLDGQSLVPLTRGEGDDGPPFLFECGWHVAPNPAVSTFAELRGRKYMYTYNLTSDRDELYDLDDPLLRNLAATGERPRMHQEMVERLGIMLERDPRWACYWHAFRLDKYEGLDVGEGDFQMFRPEH